jgi:hypothetical protein
MKEKSIRCDCIGGGHYIDVSYIEEYNKGEDKPVFTELYFNLYSEAHNQPLSYRFREAWRVLKGQSGHVDSVMFRYKYKVQELIDFLNEGKDKLEESE